MNAEFAAAAAQFIQRPKLSRKQIVTRLYRQSLKATFSWAANRDVFIMRAEELRAEFDRFKDYKPDHPEANKALKDGVKRLYDQAHPDSYVVNYMPGGCTYQRNEPQPLNAIYPDGVPEDIAAKVVPVHPDMVPLTYRPDTGPVLVDPIHAKNIVQPSLMESLQDLEVRQRRAAAEPAV